MSCMQSLHLQTEKRASKLPKYCLGIELWMLKEYPETAFHFDFGWRTIYISWDFIRALNCHSDFVSEYLLWMSKMKVDLIVNSISVESLFFYVSFDTNYKRYKAYVAVDLPLVFVVVVL